MMHRASTRRTPHHRDPEAGLIRSDRECFTCGYNLRGLKFGGRCPECGTTIEPPSRFDDLDLSRMPLRVIRTFLLGACVGAFCVLGIVGVSAAILLDYAVLDASFIFAIASVGWVAAVWLLTPAIDMKDAKIRGFSRDGVTRRIARSAQLGWMLAAASLLGQAAISSPAIDGVLEAFAILGSIGGVVGLIAMAILLERLSEWVRDGTAEAAFQWFQWLLPISLLAVLMRPLRSVTMPFNVPLSEILAIFGYVVLLLFPIGILMLARSIAYARLHAIENAARAERVRERKAKEAADMERRFNTFDG